MPKNQTYQQAVDAVDAGSNAAREAWAWAGKSFYITKSTTQPGITFYRNGVAEPYSPTAEDKAATDWNTGTGTPPVG